MAEYDYLIVGTGFSGAVFAYEAAKRGKKCIALEKRNHIGGNAYCEKIDNINVHKYGAHIFHTSDKRIWDYINQFAEFNSFINSPLANYKGEIYSLPFNMNTFSKLWGVLTPAQALSIIESQRAEIKGEPQNLKEQAIALVGQDIFEKLIEGYTEKQWGKPCDQLPASIIKRIPVRFTYNNNYFDDTYQGIPTGGYNGIFDRLLQGCDIRLNTDYHNDKENFNRLADKIFYTGMVDEYFNYQFGRLEYRSLRFETQTIDEPNHQGVAVINYTDRETPYTRIIEHKHFDKCLKINDNPRTVISIEYPTAWEPGTEAYYPINNEENQTLYNKYKTLAQKEPSVIFCGRLAEYKYYDMDDAIDSALNAVGREFTE